MGINKRRSAVFFVLLLVLSSLVLVSGCDLSGCDKQCFKELLCNFNSEDCDEDRATAEPEVEQTSSPT